MTELQSIDITGKRIALAGRFRAFNQAQAKKGLKAVGAKFTGKLKTADILFAGDGSDFYVGRANDTGVPVFGEAQLVALIGDAVEDQPTSAPPEPEPAAAPRPSAFTGKNVVLSGSFSTMNRTSAKRVLGEAGAKVQGKVNSATDLLIHDLTSSTGDLRDAQERGVPLMTEVRMVALLREAGVGVEALAGADDAMAKAQAAQEKEHRRCLAAVRRVHDAQVEQWGFTLGHLLEAYLKVFAQRPDIHVRRSIVSGPGSLPWLAHLHGKIPPWALALWAELGLVQFCWIFEDAMQSMNDFSDGFNGGQVNLKGPFRFEWAKRPEAWTARSYEKDAMVDELQPEANTFLRYEPGQKRTDAVLVFDSDEETCYQDWAAYLTLGAKHGFAWYWQDPDPAGREIVEKLRQRSHPPTLPAGEIVAGLMERGLTQAEAAGMIAWLGQDAVLLLSRIS